MARKRGVRSSIETLDRELVDMVDQLIRDGYTIREMVEKLGELDGVYYVPGFDNAVENTVTIDGKQHVVFQDVARTGFNDYYALRMD